MEHIAHFAHVHTHAHRHSPNGPSHSHWTSDLGSLCAKFICVLVFVSEIWVILESRVREEKEKEKENKNENERGKMIEKK